MSSLTLRLLDRSQVHGPGQRRTAPDLPHRWSELRTLIDPANTQPICRWAWFWRGGVDRRAAFWAEAVSAFVPALSDLEVRLRRPALQPEGSRQAGDICAKRSTGQLLTICAMANPD